MGRRARWYLINSGFLTSPTGNSHRARLTATPHRHLIRATSKLSDTPRVSPTCRAAGHRLAAATDRARTPNPARERGEDAPPVVRA